jgi:hypothetical protein
MLLRTGLLLALFFTASAALGLTTAYVSFDHPDGWRCELSQGVWICQSTVEPDRKESVVLSIATMATEWDSLDNYESYLKQPRTIQDDEGSTLTSKVTYTRRRNINGTTWIDSLQFNSELPNFWARYVATVHNRLAILITYIVSDDNYKRLAPQFERMISSLKPNAEFDLNIASKQGDNPAPGASKYGAVTQDILKERLNLKKKGDKKPEVATDAPAANNKTILYAVGGGAAATAYLVMRMRRKRKGAKPKEPTIRRAG